MAMKKSATATATGMTESKFWLSGMFIFHTLFGSFFVRLFLAF
jgi:hypothetical protein